MGWALAVAVGAGLWLGVPSRAMAQESPPTALPDSVATGAEAKRPVRYFKLFGDNWAWEPDTIRVKKGTHVVLTVKAFRATRSFKLKAYDLDVLVPQDEEVKIEFDADQAGKFPFRCGRPCGDGCAKLRGTLIVD